MIVCSGVDVWRGTGDHPLLPCRPYFPQAQPVQVAHWGERGEEELHSTGRGLDGRLQEILLRAV